MSEVPSDLKYTREHEWARLEDVGGKKVATVGITQFAVEQLGDITQVDLPKEGESFKKDDVLGSVESVKAVSDVYAPLSGKIVKVNTPLSDTPEDLADEPYDEGWMVQIELSNLAEIDGLLDADAYQAFLREQEDH
jgi:glycine cleavage system H protein